MTNATIANELRDAIAILCEDCGETIDADAIDLAAHEASTAWMGEGWYQIGRDEIAWYEVADDLAADTYTAALAANHMDEVGANYYGDGEEPTF